MLTLVNACASAPRNGPAFQERSWPAYLGGPTRTGTAADSLAPDPQPVWRTNVGRGITGAPALSEDVIAVAVVDRRVALLERVTGTQLWDRRVGAPLGAGPLIRDDRLFVAEQASDGQVHALRLLNGSTLWTADVGDVVAPLALAGNALFAATRNGMVLRLSADAGRVVWRARVPGGVRAAPLVTPGGLIVATTADTLLLLDTASGAVRARRPTPGTVLAAPALADSLLVIGTASGRILALSPTTLEVRWAMGLPDPIVGSVAVLGGRAWAITGRGALCIARLVPPLGQHLIELNMAVRAGPVPVPGGVLVSGVNGEILLVDSTGTRRWLARIEPPLVEPPLVDGRTIIAASERGHVVAWR